MIQPNTVKHHVFDAMGTTFHITLLGDNESHMQKQLSEAENVVRLWDNYFSRFRPGAELYEVNERSGAWVQVSDLFLQVLSQCIQLAKETDGSFDPSVGTALALAGYGPLSSAKETALQATFADIEIDAEHKRILCQPGQVLELAAVVKGMAIDAAGAIFGTFANYLINGGGDILARGVYGENNGWRVAIQFPDEADAIAELVTLHNMSLATSGSYAVRWNTGTKTMNHLINMKTHEPVTDILSVSVLARTASEADSLATGATVVGEEKAIAFLETKRVPYYIIASDKRVKTNALFQQNRVPITQSV